MADAFICSYVRTPIGRYGGALSAVRADDLAAIPLRALLDRHPALDRNAIDDVVYGCVTQAGEDSRNVARMAALLSGLPESVPGVTINRLCGSGMDAVLWAARTIHSGDADLVIAGGVESMSRAPFVLSKSTNPFARDIEFHDSTMGWRFVNPLMEARHGVESMPETAENVAETYRVSRQDQDAFALRSQQRAAAASASGRLAREIVEVSIPQRKGPPVVVSQDEHLRPATTIGNLARLPAPFRKNGTVTAGNASGVNDGAAALIIASEAAMKRHGLAPMARIVSGASSGVAPRLMGIGPVTAVGKLTNRLGIAAEDFDVIELNEAFASQSIAVLRELRISEEAGHVNPNGGAIALGHPLGMSGARLCGTVAMELRDRGSQWGLATMCVGVGQGVAVALARA
jgi:acetyl-CoA acyltransferase